MVLCCGLLFSNNISKKLVTRVEVFWKELKFRANYTYLSKESVIDEITNVADLQMEVVKRFKSCNRIYSMALSLNKS